MNEATKPVNPEKEAYHREAESRMHTFSYNEPAAMRNVKELVNFVRTPNVRVQVQVVTEGGENNLHYHTNSDGVWMVLRGRAKFYGAGDKLLGELGEHEGIVIPGGARYWFEKVGETDLEIVHSFGWPHAVLEQWRTFRTDAPSLLAEAFRTRTPIWINSFEALSQVYPSAVALPKARAEEAWAALPLVADGRALGALGLGFAGRRHLDDAEREFVVALAALAAQAIVRAHHRRER